jgi:KDO2-lipid IV(A) lauroyltransferase
MFSHRSSPLLEEIQVRGRLRLAHEVISSDSVRSMLRSLKKGAVIWYAPDLMYRDGVLLPFFNELAMTNVATSKIARLSGAAVLPFSYRRLERGARYEIRFFPPLADFPSDDPVEDTRRLEPYLEQFIRACPEQYQWIQKRFKGRPPELPDLYATPPRS